MCQQIIEVAVSGPVLVTRCACEEEVIRSAPVVSDRQESDGQE